VTDRELFGSVRVRRPKALRRVVPRDVLERLVKGDLVVHIDHGIARYEQMLRRGIDGQERDYLELSFAGTDKIYLPVEQINRISRYSGGEDPALSKLGGADWIRTKARVKKAVTDLAKELLEIYAARAAAPGFAYPRNTPWQQELEASFPYEETQDQLKAVAEMKDDMEAGRPMDRLVVGDVGYGKTEVALRGVFKGHPGRQAGRDPGADDRPRRPALLDVQPAFRRLPAHGAAAVAIRSGQGAGRHHRRVGRRAVDVVIGTHRLLSKDVTSAIWPRRGGRGAAFRRGCKERLKKLRREVDVLTLSATADPANAQPRPGRRP